MPALDSQGLVVGVQYARSLEQVTGIGDGFGARFVVERSTDGITWTKVLETPSFQTGFFQALSSAVSPSSFPAYSRSAQSTTRPGCSPPASPGRCTLPNWRRRCLQARAEASEFKSVRQLAWQ